jgi:hypothetical protein
MPLSHPNVEETRRLTADVDRYVTFVGYPRSGHSLVGSLLDAHKNMIIAHELDAMRMLERGAGKYAIWDAILQNSREFTDSGRQWQEYKYDVPGQWNGRFEDLRVIGDKKGGRTTLRLGENPELLAKLQETMEVRCQFVHVVRNPFDNISTMANRGNLELTKAIHDYFLRCDYIVKLKPRISPENWIDVRHESVIENPKQELLNLCSFVQQPTADDYLEACASIVFPSPKKTRHSAAWTPTLIKQVQNRIGDYYQLEGYSFES